MSCNSCLNLVSLEDMLRAHVPVSVKNLNMTEKINYSLLLLLLVPD